MGILSIFSPKDRSTVINGAVDLVSNVRSMIDDSKFTNEEAMRANMEIADKMADFVGDTLNENTERSKTRRYIAILYMSFFLFLVLALIIVWKFDKEWADFIYKIIIDFNLALSFITVIGFFFGSYMFRQYIGQSKKNK